MIATALTPAGWAFMALSIGSVCGLTWWCFKKVLFPPHEEPKLPGGLGA